MEDGLVLSLKQFMHVVYLSLNPCCNGRWSRTHFKMPTGKDLEKS